MRLAPEVTEVLTETAATLAGVERRLFMARAVCDVFEGHPHRAANALGWDVRTLRKGLHELRAGVECYDGRTGTGRPRAETRLPDLLQDLRDLLDSQSQVDPRFGSQRLYTRMTVAEVRRQLHAQKGYAEAALPSAETLRGKINALGYTLRKVQKVKPKKVLPQTAAIFDAVSAARAVAARTPNVLEVSLDAKATVKVGEFSRHGVSRVPVAALDHDFGAAATVTPYGILLPAQGELALYLTTGPVTADFIVDHLAVWWAVRRARFPRVDTLLLLQDNGPENHSRRTRYLERMVTFAHTQQLDIRLAYYPPYHSKFNPVERCWGILEQHWNGALLDSVAAVTRYAQTMTWRGVAPEVHLVTTPYAKGVSLTRKEMAKVETQVCRRPGLEPWFVDIPHTPHRKVGVA